MARMNRDEMAGAVVDVLGATADESGGAEFVAERGSIILAAEAGDMKSAFKRIKKVDGYRWVVINKADLFAANSLSIGSKAGLITPDGEVLKNADLPRKKM